MRHPAAVRPALSCSLLRLIHGGVPTGSNEKIGPGSAVRVWACANARRAVLGRAWTVVRHCTCCRHAPHVIHSHHPEVIVLVKVRAERETGRRSSAWSVLRSLRDGVASD